MWWICPKCKATCYERFCPKCGQEKVELSGNNVGQIDATISKLMKQVHTLRIISIVLIVLFVVMAGLFAFAYYSVWENIGDLWSNAYGFKADIRALYESSDGLWYNVERLWDELWYMF